MEYWWVMTFDLSLKQQELVDYLLNQSLTNLDNEKIQALVSGMTAQDLTECMEEAQTRIQQLKATGLGRELL